MRKLTFLAAALFLQSYGAAGAECSHLWNKNLEINPQGPKGYVGDTYAAYGLLGYKNVPNLAWRFEFKFPKSRFVSIETYTDTKKLQHDAQFDYEFNPAPGSQNPYRDGIPMDVEPRDVVVHLVPGEGHSKVSNVIHISPDAPIHAVYYRVYVPSAGVTITENDLPKIYAYDVVSGEDVTCPEAERGVIFAPDLPQSVIAWVRPKKFLQFKKADETIFARLSASGNNAAVPSYLYSLSRMRANQVALIQFKSPTFFDAASGRGPFKNVGDVRYWSFCTQNLVKGDTLRCLPDFLSAPDENGYVRVVIGRGQDVKEYALSRGFDFIDDVRGDDQPVLQMIYRNLLPNAEFSENSLYQGDYIPSGKICSKRLFLSGRCDF